MPHSPSSSQGEQEAVHSSNSSVSAPLSPLARTSEPDDDPNAMSLVAVMASFTDRTRLVASRSRDDGQSQSGESHSRFALPVELIPRVV